MIVKCTHICDLGLLKNTEIGFASHGYIPHIHLHACSASCLTLINPIVHIYLISIIFLNPAGFAGSFFWPERHFMTNGQIIQIKVSKWMWV